MNECEREIYVYSSRMECRSFQFLLNHENIMNCKKNCLYRANMKVKNERTHE